MPKHVHQTDQEIVGVFGQSTNDGTSNAKSLDQYV